MHFWKSSSISGMYNYKVIDTLQHLIHQDIKTLRHQFYDFGINIFNVEYVFYYIIDRFFLLITSFELGDK